MGHQRPAGRQAGGFTLLELMVAVAIVSVLASAAIPYFLRYMQDARNIEGVHNIQKIADATKAYFLARNRPPSTDCSGSPVRCTGNAFDPAVWNHVVCQNNGGVHPPSANLEFTSEPIWKMLMFRPEGTIRFNYFYDNPGMWPSTPSTMNVWHFNYRFESCAPTEGRYVWYQMWVRWQNGGLAKLGPVKGTGVAAWMP